MTLSVALIILIPGTVTAQTDKFADSLITAKKEFKKNDTIEFTVKFNKNSKIEPHHVRMVSTMSCACSNKDFYYVVYRIANINDTSNKKAFINHFEKPDAERCECKTRFAEFYDGKKYFIPSIKEKGNYFILIEGGRFVMISNVFTVTD